MNTLQYNDEVILHIKFGKLRERESGRVPLECKQFQYRNSLYEPA